MTDLVTLQVGAFHVAYLCPMTGMGYMTRPPVESDVYLGGDSVHAADWNAAIATLDGLGWEPLEDEDGLPMVDRLTADGGDIIGLYGREPITSDVSLVEVARAGEALMRLATGGV